MSVRKIISGGQTGVDRAALDAARQFDIAIGGWCPRGRLAEDGSITGIYPLSETPSKDYVQRTTWNVRDSDGTLVLHAGTMAGGTLLTLEKVRELEKPVYECNLSTFVKTEKIVQWLQEQNIRVLNIAGPRESESPGIYRKARVMMEALLPKLIISDE